VAQRQVQWTEGVSDLTGTTGLTSSRLLLAGERRAETVARPRDPRCTRERATLVQALHGTGRQEQVLALAHAVARYDVAQKHLIAGDQPIATGLTACETKAASEAAAKRPRQRQGTAPACAVWTSRSQRTGVDLPPMDGLDGWSALQGISESGRERTRGPTATHVAAWRGVGPGHNSAGGKRYRSRTKPTANRAAAAFRRAAQTRSHRHRALGAYDRRRRARLGAPGAMTATAHTLARIV
jgi:transposase